nr:hypothetical protein [Sobelivirales sp.]
MALRRTRPRRAASSRASVQARRVSAMRATKTKSLPSVLRAALRTRKPKTQTRRGPMMSAAIVDARQGIHLAPPMATAPYAVLRTRVSFTLATNTFGQYRVALFGEHSNTAFAPEINVTPLLAIHGIAMDPPGVTETYVSDPQALALPTGAFLRLHALTVTTQCGSTATTAEGFFYQGTMPGNITRSSFTSWNDMALALITRREAKMHAAYGSITKPAVSCCAPQDATEWSTNALLGPVSGVPGSNRSTDCLLPVALVLLPTTVAVNYTVTLNCQWRIVYPMGDSRAGLHTTHPVSSIGSVRAATTAVSLGTSSYASGSSGSSIGARTLRPSEVGGRSLGRFITS